MARVSRAPRSDAHLRIGTASTTGPGWAAIGCSSTVAPVTRVRCRLHVGGGVGTPLARAIHPHGGVGSTLGRAVVPRVRVRASYRIAVRIGARPVRRAAIGLRARRRLAMETGVALVLQNERIAAIALASRRCRSRRRARPATTRHARRARTQASRPRDCRNYEPYDCRGGRSVPDHHRGGDSVLGLDEIRRPALDLEPGEPWLPPGGVTPSGPVKYGTLAARWLNSSRNVMNSSRHVVGVDLHVPRAVLVPGSGREVRRSRRARSRR